MKYNRFIKESNDLVTRKENTRKGFIMFAFEKSKRAIPYVEQAKILKFEAEKANSPIELLNIPSIRPALLAASGLSDKSMKYFSENDMEEAIKELIHNFLEPAGSNFTDELVYRFLLIKGDSLGGQMRNIIGALAEKKLKRSFIASLLIRQINFKWINRLDEKGYWISNVTDIENIEENAKAISWKYGKNEYILAFNLTVPLVKKNVDLILFNACDCQYDNGKLVKDSNKILMLGELKGGIDPAGADEHWKTANSALERIRQAFDRKIRTSFIGAAIEKDMSEEIFKQLSEGKLTNAANLYDDQQLSEFCSWLVDIGNDETA